MDSFGHFSLLLKMRFPLLLWFYHDSLISSERVSLSDAAQCLFEDLDSLHWDRTKDRGFCHIPAAEGFACALLIWEIALVLKATAVDFMELTDCVQGGCFFLIT